MKNKNIKASFVNLGCFKNIVDTEVLGGMLSKQGIEIVSSYEKSDWIIINTCGFIRDAKEESIEEIFNAFELKESGEVKHVAVFGCLIQRYYEEIKENFKNADILWGVNNLRELADSIAENSKSEYKEDSLFLYDHNYQRIISTTPNTTFIKISEGCNMKCSFCSIPSIRGKFRSRDISSIIREAEKYKKMGFKEVNLISQNSTYFGRDKGSISLLPELLKEISQIGLDWIRVLYLMPEDVDDKTIEAINYPGILPYFDLPFQHSSPSILKRMHRGGGFYSMNKLINRIREVSDKSIIRSSFIVGFPGETEEDFKHLLDFAEQSKIERIGVFGYSDEENTPAFNMKDKLIPDIIEYRKEELLNISDKNIEIYNKKIIGSSMDFLPLGSWDNNSTIGRISSQAPETDGLTRINVPFTRNYDIYRIKITGYDHELVIGEKI